MPRCKPCGIFTHTFTCTCLDSILHSTICKHIHLVILGGDADKVHNEGFIENHPHVLLSQVKHPQATCDHNLRTLRNTVQSLTSEIQLHIKDCSDANALQVLKQCLYSDIGVFTALINTSTSQTSLTPTTEIVPNTNHQTLYSTRKRRQTTMNTLSKPSIEEIATQRKKLKMEEPQLCGICLEQSVQKNGATIDWIQCASCNLWVHTACIMHRQSQSTGGLHVSVLFCLTKVSHFVIIIFHITITAIIIYFTSGIRMLSIQIITSHMLP